MDRREYLLTCLAEECAEVAQRVSKILRFGPEEIQPGQTWTNTERLLQELGDLVAVQEILQREGHLPKGHCDTDAKLMKIEKFMVLSRAQGTLITKEGE